MTRLFLLFSLVAPVAFAKAKKPSVPKAVPSVIALFEAPAEPKRELTADEVFRKLEPFVRQLKTAVRADAPKRSYGSAFVVDRNGLLMTNYHVVSDAVQWPRKYKVFLETKTAPMEAQIVALDVVHDLAIVKVPKIFEGELKLNVKPPPQGYRLYSLGLPRDLNLSIIEGVFNESIEQGVYKELHLSTPLNSGMSGGPTVDPWGEVVGVNVSMLGDSQNVSFAVPADFAEPLLEQSKRQLASDAPSRPAWQADIGAQLFRVQQDLTADLLKAGKESLDFEGWQVPKPPAYLKCWGDDATEKKQAYTGYRQVCFLPFSSYLADSLTTGTLELRYEVYRPGALNALQYASLLSERYNEDFEAVSEFILSLGDESHRLLTDAKCRDHRFKNGAGVEIKANYCLRAYARHQNLVDADFKWITPVRSGAALLVEGTLRGFHPDSLKAFLKLQWEGIRRAKP
jgi:serine protease Do